MLVPHLSVSALCSKCSCGIAHQLAHSCFVVRDEPTINFNQQWRRTRGNWPIKNLGTDSVLSPVYCYVPKHTARLMVAGWRSDILWNIIRDQNRIFEMDYLEKGYKAVSMRPFLCVQENELFHFIVINHNPFNPLDWCSIYVCSLFFALISEGVDGIRVK